MLPFLLLLILVLPHHPFFIEYKTISYFASDGKTIYGLLIENVTNIFPNGTVKYEFYLINLNYSQYAGPLIVYNNLSSPTSLYFFPQVGEKVVQRGNLTFTLIGEQDGYYVYENTQHPAQLVTVITYYYVNESGVPYKIVFLQYGINGLVSNNTFVLYSSNLISPNAKIYFPSGLTRVTSPITVTSINGTIQNYILSFLVVGVVLISVYKLFSKKKYKNNS
ncbi:hypothetical protein SJAV_11090 [Sulfurisphaera javensis]|uniref:Uncharacterized protein n=1 Tax=Sulfurisphaera javensis TaxID=2049879 RepID=A0AAT9GQP2_9CREN